eukprot:5198179-Prymnesium_polylepis.1
MTEDIARRCAGGPVGIIEETRDQGSNPEQGECMAIARRQQPQVIHALLWSRVLKLLDDAGCVRVASGSFREWVVSFHMRVWLECVGAQRMAVSLSRRREEPLHSRPPIKNLI